MPLTAPLAATVVAAHHPQLSSESISGLNLQLPSALTSILTSRKTDVAPGLPASFGQVCLHPMPNTTCPPG